MARHDAAHVVASVVQRLFPGTQVTIGPTIEDGFYYDFAREQPFTPEDLAKIEAATNAEIAADHPDVETAYNHVDAACMYMVGSPERYDVIVTDNLFGDILTDLAGAVAGGIGRAASANLNPARTGPVRPSASASSRAVSLRAVRWIPVPGH